MKPQSSKSIEKRWLRTCPFGRAPNYRSEEASRWVIVENGLNASTLFHVTNFKRYAHFLQPYILANLAPVNVNTIVLAHNIGLIHEDKRSVARIRITLHQRKATNITNCILLIPAIVVELVR